MVSAPGKARLYAPSLVTLAILLPFFAYYVRQVKTQEGYQNSRAFRVLDVASRQFATQVKGARDTMDAATRVRHEFAVRERSDTLTSEAGAQLAKCAAPGNCDAAARAEAEAYLRTFLVDTDFISYEEPVEGLERGDSFRLSRRQGITPAQINLEVRRPVFLSARRPPAPGVPDKVDKLTACRIRASLNPSRMLTRAAGREIASVFETVMVATEDGAVIAQTPSSVANVSNLESLLALKSTKRRVEDGAAASEPQSAMPTVAGEAVKLAAKFSGAEERVNVEVAGAPYVLFSIPAPITLGAEGDGESAALVFHGLVSKDALEARAMQLPSLSVPALLMALIMGMALLWPLLLLQTVSPKERLRKSTLALMAGSSILAATLFAALFLVTGFALRLNREHDGRLNTLSRQIQTHFAWETDQAIRTAQETMEYLAAMRTPGPPTGFFSLRHLLDGPGGAGLATGENQKLREDLLSYPYFVHMILTSDRDPQGSPGPGGGERQILKLSADPVPTPLIPLPEAAFPFVGRLLNGPYATARSVGSSKAEEFTLESLISPNTGEFLPVMMFYPAASKADGKTPPLLKRADYRVTITTPLPSLVRAVLPRGFGFAVVNDDGRVLFHSDTTRNLKENFLGECDEPAELERLVTTHSSGWLSLRYGGKKVRIFVQPLAAGDAAGSEGLSQSNKIPEIKNLDLSLIAYYDADADKDLFYVVARDFLLVAVGLPLAALLVALVWIQLAKALFPRSQARYSNERLWPWEVEKPYYILEGIWGISWFLFAVAAGVFCPMASRGEDGQVPLPWRILLLLLFALLAGLGGLILSWRKHRWAAREAGRSWLNPWKPRIPLSAAFSLRLFSGTLAIMGPVALVIFQFVLWKVQSREDEADVRAAARAMDLRKERNFHAWSKSSAAKKDCGSAAGLSCQFQEARIQGAGYFDLYDAVACPQAANVVTERLKGIAPAMAGAVTPQGKPESHAGVENAGPCSASPSRTTPWRVAPEIQLDGRFNWRGLGFHGLGLLVIALLFLWKHSLIRRLFILDFRRPEPLSRTDEARLRQAMETALSSGPQNLQRTLIFSHPRSGTGEALRRILESVKQRNLIPAEYAPLDCPTLLGGRLDDDGGWRRRAIEAQAAGNLAILDNFATGLIGDADRKDKLALLERVVYARKSHVYVVTSLDPLLVMQSLTAQRPADETLRQESDRWARVLSTFERMAFEEERQDSEMDAAVEALERHGKALGLPPNIYAEYGEMFESELNATAFLRRCASRIDLQRLDWSTPRHFEQSLVVQVRALADGFYRVVWLNCTGDERLGLFQLAKDEWMNPLNKAGIAHLLRKNLVRNVSPGDAGRKGGAFRLMNESFRQFVLEAVEEREAAAWAAEQNQSLWPSLRMALMLAVGLLVLFTAYVRRDIFDVYFSYFAALAGGGAALVKIALQLFSKDESKLVAALGGGKVEKGGEERV